MLSPMTSRTRAIGGRLPRALWAPHPVWQRFAACGAGGVLERVGPFALQRLLVALDLAVGARRVGPRADVADRAAVEQFAQRAVVDVGERVVAHQPLGDDAVLEEEIQRALGERGHRRRGLVVMDL